MKHIRIVFLIICLLALSMTAQAVSITDIRQNYYAIPAKGVDHDPKILMVGNSHTFKNDIPGMLEKMYANFGQNAEITSVTAGGRKLCDFVFPKNSSQEVCSDRLFKYLEEQDWDYVILQGQREETRTSPGEMKRAVGVIKDMLEGKATQIVLYMPWASKNPGSTVKTKSNIDLTLSDMVPLYYSIAKTYQVALAPSGISMDRARVIYPNIGLYAGDDRHASYAGSYLSACTIFATLSGYNPEDLTYHGKCKIYTANKLQKIAAQVVLYKTPIKSGDVGAAKQQSRIYTKNKSVNLNNTKSTSAKWVSSNPTIATVNSKGVVRTRQAGKVTISRINRDGSVSFWRLYISNKSYTVWSGDSLWLRELVPNISLKWKSSNKSIAYVSGNCLIARKSGKVKLTGTGKNGKRYIVQIIVKQQPSVKIMNAPRVMKVGERIVLKTNVNEIDYRKTVSSNLNVISISQSENGVIKACRPGKAIITVWTRQGKKKSIAITVVADMD